jgi:hypothetical protein
VERDAEVALQQDVQREAGVELRVVRLLVAHRVAAQAGDVMLDDEVDQAGLVGQAGFVEVGVERLRAVLVEHAEDAGAQQQDVAPAQLGVLRRQRVLDVADGDPPVHLQVRSPFVPGQVGQHRPADDPALGQRADARAGQAAGRRPRRVAVPQPVAAPGVAERVHVGRAVAGQGDAVLGVLRAAGQRRRTAVGVVALVMVHDVPGRGTPRQDGVSVRAEQGQREGEPLAGADAGRRGRRDQGVVEQVGPADLVLLAPAAPVLALAVVRNAHDRIEVS